MDSGLITQLAWDSENYLFEVKSFGTSLSLEGDFDSFQLGKLLL